MIVRRYFQAAYTLSAVVLLTVLFGSVSAALAGLPNGWTIGIDLGSDAGSGYDSGACPSPQPLTHKFDSHGLFVDVDSCGSKINIVTGAYNGLPLSDLTELNYTIDVDDTSTSSYPPYWVFYVDDTGSATNFNTRLRFSQPIQAGQSTVDMMTLPYWFTTIGGPYFSLDDYRTLHPNARLAPQPFNQPTAQAIQLQAGDSADNYVGLIFTLGTIRINGDKFNFADASSHGSDDSDSGPGASSFIPDGRLNGYDAGSPVAIYPTDFGGTGTGLNIYGIDPLGNGWLALSVSPAEIAAVPEHPAVNTLIKATADGSVALYRLTTGEFQINFREPSGKTSVTIFDGLGPGAHYETHTE